MKKDKPRVGDSVELRGPEMPTLAAKIVRMQGSTAFIANPAIGLMSAVPKGSIVLDGSEPQGQWIRTEKAKQ